MDQYWPICEPGTALDLSESFRTAQRDFSGLVDRLRTDISGLVANNDSEDIRAAEAFFNLVTHEAVLDGLPQLLGKIGDAVSAYKYEVEGWKDRFHDALIEGLAAAGCVVVAAIIIDLLTEVGWAALGVEMDAAVAAAVRAVAPVAVSFAAAAEAVAAGAAAGVGVFTVEMAKTPDPNVTPADTSGLRYEGSPKHGPTQRGNIAPEPKDGQAALERSVQIKPTSTRRVGVDPKNDEIVIFDETHNGTGIYHGHIRSWEELRTRPDIQNALIRAGLADKKGRIIP